MRKEGFSARLRAIAVLVSALSLLSWGNHTVVAGVNRLLHQPALADAGWQGYTYCRLLVSAGVVWLIVGLGRSVSSRSVSGRSVSGQPVSGRPQRAGEKVARPPRESRFDSLMGLRALAAVMVLLGHYFALVFALPKPQAGLQWILYSLVEGCPYAGVWVFFTLSGYLMGKGFRSRYQLTEEGIFAFYRNRMLRILPLYVGALFLVGLFTSPGLFLPRNWWQWIEVCLFDYRGDLPLPPIGALWSVSTEVQFYLLAPFLFALLSRCRRVLKGRFFVVPFGLLTMWVLLRHAMLAYLQGRTSSDGAQAVLDLAVYKPLVMNVDLFAAGMSLNLVSLDGLSRWMRSGRPGVLLTMVAVVLFTGTALALGITEANGRLVSLFFIAMPFATSAMAMLYIALAEAHGPFAWAPGGRSIPVRAVQWIGVLTYAIYVFHLPVFQALRRTVPPGPVSPESAFHLFPLAIGVLLLLALFFYRFLEEPFEKKKALPETELTDAP